MTEVTGAYECRLTYATTISGQQLSHKHQFNVRLSTTPAPGTPFDEISVLNWDASTQELGQMLTAYFAVLLPLIPDEAVLEVVELWHYPDGGSNAIYISAGGYGSTGTNVGAPRAAGQATFTFRTLAGGLMKMVLMESSLAGDLRQSYGAVPAGIVKNYMDFIGGTEHAIAANDSFRPFAPIAFIPGQNEAVYRKRFRQS